VPEPVPECLSNADCDNNIFCDGLELCFDGACVAGAAPCLDDEICMEDADQCWDYETLSGLSLQPAFVRPFLFDRKCPWLVLQVDGGSRFRSEASMVTMSGPAEDAAGVSFDRARSPFAFFDFIIVPFCIEREAAPGPWTVIIETREAGSNQPFVEQIRADFEVQ